jgi:uncharacterized protein DUF6265
MLALSFTGAMALSLAAGAQYAPGKAPASPPAAPAAESASRKALAELAWLAGCWHGNVNQREFREHWLPMGGGMLVGAGQTVTQDATQDYEYLRLEARPDGVYYVTLPSGQKESTFKLTGTATDDKENAQTFTFTNAADEFPQRIVYRRGGDGWLYASIEGTSSGAERKVIYPMRHVSCETGEVLRK